MATRKKIPRFQKLGKQHPLCSDKGIALARGGEQDSSTRVSAQQRLGGGRGSFSSLGRWLRAVGLADSAHGFSGSVSLCQTPTAPLRGSCRMNHAVRLAVAVAVRWRPTQHFCVRAPSHCLECGGRGIRRWDSSPPHQSKIRSPAPSRQACLGTGGTGLRPNGLYRGGGDAVYWKIRMYKFWRDKTPCHF